MKTFFHFAIGSFVFIVLPISACTTNLKQATDAYDQGNFGVAASSIDTLAPTKVKNGKMTIEVSYDRDQLWVGLEKAKMLGDAGKFNESIDLFTHVDAEAEDLREIESWYLENPFAIDAWDAGQFANDLGQSVMGADQLPYLLQPYEMILVDAYASLYCLLHNKVGAAAYARKIMRLQQFEKLDLQSAGYDDLTAPTAKMDSALLTSSSVKSTDISFARIFSLGDFTGSKARMKSTITAARDVGAADPRVPFATVIQWAAFMKEGLIEECEEAAKQVKGSCGAETLSKQMMAFSKNLKNDYVLVLIDAGRGPVRSSFEVKFPFVIPNVGASYFRAVYPDLVFRVADRPSNIMVGGVGKMEKASIIDSIDAIAARNFQRREKELWWTPTFRAVLRAVATVVAQATQKEEDKTSKAIIGLFGAAVAAAEQPDLRSWSTLPASQYAALIPRPANGMVNVELKSQASSGSIQVKVGPGSSIVYVRALTPSIQTVQTASVTRK